MGLGWTHRSTDRFTGGVHSAVGPTFTPVGEPG